jgi:restriction endonuclease Mrr
MYLALAVAHWRFLSSARLLGWFGGRSGDDGVDGVIDQDALGLDRIYIQAKRYAFGNNTHAELKLACLGRSARLSPASQSIFCPVRTSISAT